MLHLSDSLTVVLIFCLAQISFSMKKKIHTFTGLAPSKKGRSACYQNYWPLSNSLALCEVTVRGQVGVLTHPIPDSNIADQEKWAKMRPYYTRVLWKYLNDVIKLFGCKWLFWDQYIRKVGLKCSWKLYIMKTYAYISKGFVKQINLPFKMS